MNNDHCFNANYILAKRKSIKDIFKSLGSGGKSITHCWTLMLLLLFATTLVVAQLGMAAMQSPGTPGDTSLVAEWHFDEGSGNLLIDSSGNGNDGIIYGATWTTEGKFGSALQFDGMNDYVEIPDSPELSGGTGKNLTVEFWFKSNQPSGHIITKWQDISYKDWGIFMGSWINGPPALSFYYEKDDPNNDMRFYGGTIQENVWNHGAFTFEAESPAGANNAKLTLYLNGEKLNLNFWNDHPPYNVLPNQLYDMPDTGVPVSIGYSGKYYNSGYFNGVIDEIKIYNRVLSSEEIIAEYEKGTPPATSVTVTSPNGGENWQTGSTQTIQWSYTGNPGAEVTIEILKGGVVVETYSSIPIGNGGSGFYDWTIPSNITLGTGYKVRITSISNNAYTDTSDGDFTINSIPPVPIIDIIKPCVIFEGTFNQFNYGIYPMIMEIKSVDGLEFNGILHWPTLGNSKTKFKGKIDSILNQIWFTEYEQIQGSVTIVLNGNYYAELKDNTLSGYWNWPNGVKGGLFSIKLSSTSCITVTSPNGGENWQTGTTHTIQWSYTGDLGPDVKIELLKGGVVLDPPIVSSTPIGNSGSGSYDWTIPSALTLDTDYQVRITNTTNNAYTDTSDGNFTISAPPLSVKIISPKNDDKFSKSGMITFKGEISGGTPEFTYTWIVDSNPNTHIEKKIERISEWSFPASLMDIGDHAVKLKVIDSGGNVAESESINFKVFDKLVAIIPVEFNDMLHQTPASDLKTKADYVVKYYDSQSYGQAKIGYKLYQSQNDDGWYRISEDFLNIENGNYGLFPPQINLECTYSGNCALPSAQNTDPDMYIWYVAMERTGLDVIRTDWGIKLKNYDVGMIVFPQEAQRSGPSNWAHTKVNIPSGGQTMAWVDAINSYGVWAHELGHAFYDLHDMDGEHDAGYIGNWGVMGFGFENPPAPIILFNKNHAQWINWTDRNYGTYPVVPINDKRMLEEGALRYKTNSGNVEYYIFEGRYPYDEIKNETGLEVNNPLKLEEGIQLYSVDQGNRVYFVSRCWLDDIFCTGGGLFGEALVKVTMVPGETRIIDDAEVQFTTIKENGGLKIKIDKYIPFYKKIWNIEIFNLFNPEGGIPEYSNLDVNLVVVSSDGKKVGMDYISGIYHNDIKDAHTSGNILGGGPEWISIDQNIDANAYIDLTAELKELIKNDELLNVKINAKLIVYDENGNRKESVPIPININSENVDSQLTILLPINIVLLPPITTMEEFSLTDGSTLPIKFTARDKDTNEFIYDESVKVIITDSKNQQMTSFVYGIGTDSIRIDSTEEQYIVNLHTKDYVLNVGETYTVTVTFGEPSLRGFKITKFTLVEGGKAKGK